MFIAKQLENIGNKKGIFKVDKINKTLRLMDSKMQIFFMVRFWSRISSEAS